MTKQPRVKIWFENEKVAEEIKENATTIFAGYPKITVSYEIEKGLWS